MALTLIGALIALMWAIYQFVNAVFAVAGGLMAFALISVCTEFVNKSELFSPAYRDFVSPSLGLIYSVGMLVWFYGFEKWLLISFAVVACILSIIGLVFGLDAGSTLIGLLVILITPSFLKKLTIPIISWKDDGEGRVECLFNTILLAIISLPALIIIGEEVVKLLGGRKQAIDYTIYFVIPVLYAAIYASNLKRNRTPTDGIFISLFSVAAIAAISAYFWGWRDGIVTPPVTQTPPVAVAVPAPTALPEASLAKDVNGPVDQSEPVTHPQGQEQYAQQQAEQVPFAPTPAVASLNLLDHAVKCGEVAECIAVMLLSVDHRSPEALHVAAARISERNKAQRGDRREARKLNEMGLAEFKKKDLGGAMSLLKQANIADPADVEILSNLGYVALQANQINDAVTALEEALLLDPRRTSTWVPIAEVYAIRNEHESAVRALLLGYEFSGNKEKTLSVYEDQSSMAERELMRSVYAEALRKATVLRGN
ncbi:tetratricopeptide repeat protein [Niveibacterium sp.]|uniref:tetratricopeptide repeat protein n=1 Tax=Niveibacterium sp. TaxID=2017444 RepID=UPI0035AE7E4A